MNGITSDSDIDSILCEALNCCTNGRTLHIRVANHYGRVCAEFTGRTALAFTNAYERWGVRYVIFDPITMDIFWLI